MKKFFVFMAFAISTMSTASALAASPGSNDSQTPCPFQKKGAGWAQSVNQNLIKPPTQVARNDEAKSHPVRANSASQ